MLQRLGSCLLQYRVGSLLVQVAALLASVGVVVFVAGRSGTEDYERAADVDAAAVLRSFVNGEQAVPQAMVMPGVEYIQDTYPVCAPVTAEERQANLRRSREARKLAEASR